MDARVNDDLAAPRPPERPLERPLERPGAPALEKGLDLLEALAAAPAGLTQKQLALHLGRTVGEIFRMLGVLERRGYIGRDPNTGEYGLSLRLFQLAAQHPPARRLQQAALPVMEELARSLGQNCHLGMVSGEQFIVVAQAETDRPMGWTVKLGAVFPLAMPYVSARVLAAFQNPKRRAELAAILARNGGAQPADVMARLDRIAAAGHDVTPSEIMRGLTDMSGPVLDHSGHAVAALTVPFLALQGEAADQRAAVALLRGAASRISEKLGGPVAG